MVRVCPVCRNIRESNQTPPPQQLHQITYFGTSPSPIDINIDAGIGYCD